MRNLIMLAVCLLLLAGKAVAADTFTDGTGRQVAYGQDCQRIVSLMPNLTEMVAFLGYADRLVGKSSYCNYPDSIVSVDDIGGQVDASLEKIVALQPDIVLAYQGNSLELVDQLRQLGIQVCALKEATTVREIGEQMWTLEGILGTSFSWDKALPVEFAKWIEKETAGREYLALPGEPSCFFGYPGELVYTCGSSSFINDVMLRCGLANAVSLDYRWPAVSAEFIMASDPDWILTTTSCTEEEDPADARSEMLAELRKDPVFRELRAVKQGQLVVVNSDHLLRPGPRILLAIDEIKEQLNAPVTGSVSNNGASAAR
ncbi:ABC transporter substrate-binding protein [bacterium]|nr:ABC transporter substrate-binding protein [bacterium]